VRDGRGDPREKEQAGQRVWHQKEHRCRTPYPLSRNSKTRGALLSVDRLPLERGIAASGRSA
jgi:hypothetical protein